MLQIDNLSVEINNNLIIDKFSYKFKPNNIYTIVAKNGSGKTTLFKSIMGLIPSSGSVKIDGRPLKSKKRSIFFMEDSSWLDDNLTGYDYLKFIKKRWQSNINLNDPIKRWDMAKFIKRKIKTYSLGMRQKLLIALYEMSDAKYLLMDEINNGLDEDSRDLLYDFLKELRDDGKTIIMSSHYKDDVMGLTNVVLEINNSKIGEM